MSTHPPAIAALIAACDSLLDEIRDRQIDEYSDCILALRDALLAAEASPIQPAPGVGWIKADKEPSKTGDYYIVVVDNIKQTFVCQGFWSNANEYWLDNEDADYPIDERGWAVTHWMEMPPLPPPPKGQL